MHKEKDAQPRRRRSWRRFLPFCRDLRVTCRKNFFPNLEISLHSVCLFLCFDGGENAGRRREKKEINASQRLRASTVFNVLTALLSPLKRLPKLLFFLVVSAVIYALDRAFSALFPDHFKSLARGRGKNA